MKALSIWQPWATLIMTGHKRIETRCWVAPYAIRGQRIAIASTKTIRREQRVAAAESSFQMFYSETGLPELDELNLGCILGTVVVEGCREIDSDLIKSLEPREEAFGIYGPGRFAWQLVSPQLLPVPIPAKGGQGLWSWKGDFSPTRQGLS